MKYKTLLALLLMYTGVQATAAGPSEKLYDTTLINLKICKRWKLVELNGQRLSDMANPPVKVPYMELDSKRRIAGYSGCNRFFGTYELNPNDRVSFSAMGMTRMACAQENNVEADLMQVLSSADSFVLVRDTLVLNRARMAPLARFVRMKSNPDKKKSK
jgi:heat shock protein HslJ